MAGITSSILFRQFFPNQIKSQNYSLDWPRWPLLHLGPSSEQWSSLLPSSSTAISGCRRGWPGRRGWSRPTGSRWRIFSRPPGRGRWSSPRGGPRPSPRAGRAPWGWCRWSGSNSRDRTHRLECPEMKFKVIISPSEVNWPTWNCRQSSLMERSDKFLWFLLEWKTPFQA